MTVRSATRRESGDHTGSLVYALVPHLPMSSAIGLPLPLAFTAKSAGAIGSSPATSRGKARVSTKRPE